MKIKFNQNCELEVITPFDEETGEAKTENDIYLIGNEIDAGVVDVNWQFRTATIQFADGSVTYGVPLDVFEVTDCDLDKEFNKPYPEPV